MFGASADCPMLLNISWYTSLAVILSIIGRSKVQAVFLSWQDYNKQYEFPDSVPQYSVRRDALTGEEVSTGRLALINVGHSSMIPDRVIPAGLNQQQKIRYRDHRSDVSTAK